MYGKCCEPEKRQLYKTQEAAMTLAARHKRDSKDATGISAYGVWHDSFGCYPKGEIL